MKKNYFLLIIFCFSLLSFQVNHDNIFTQTLSNENSAFVNSKLMAYTTLEPIFIDGNSNLIQFAKDHSLTGTGIQTDPILIQNFEISNNSYQTNIMINNTNLFIVIQNNLLGNVVNPILLENDTNIKIYNNNISNVWSVIQTGISVDKSTKITIDSNTIYDWASNGIGIHLQNTMYSIITSNSINTNNVANDMAIRLDTSSINTIIHNQIVGTGFYGIFILNNSSYNSITFNNINLSNTNANDIYISNFCNQNSVSSNTLITTYIGIGLGNSFTNSLLNNTIYSQNTGISVSYGTANNISLNYIVNTNPNLKDTSTIGIFLGSSNNNFLLKNTIINEFTGIDLFSSYGNIFLFSFLTTNSLLKMPGSGTNRGIWITPNSGENLFNESTISNFFYAFYIQDPTTILTFNNFIDNGYQTSQGYINGNSTTIKYNYWSDFTSPDNNHDGIVDYSYFISGNNPQNYDSDPLVTMFNKSIIYLSTIRSGNSLSTNETNPTSTKTSTKASDGFIAIPAIIGLSSVLIARKYRKKSN